MAYVRMMLTRYVDTKIAPGDLVAIIRTAGGVGALQQLTVAEDGSKAVPAIQWVDFEVR